MRDHFAASRDQIRQLDRIAIEQYGIPGEILMENAGRHCAGVAAEMLEGVEGRRIIVLCGRGNNGGDGFVAARHLSNWGARARVLLLARAEAVLAEPGESALNLRIALNMGLSVSEVATPEAVIDAMRAAADADLLVDGLLGTGTQGEVREPYRTAIEEINAAGVPVLAIDLPSGMDCDTGRPLGVAVRADRTVTFVFAKLGFRQPGASAYTGRVEVAEISIPRHVIDQKLREWTSQEGSP